MKNTRRIKRMGRANKKPAALNLTSLMDVFTILVFFLLVNQSASEVVEPPKEIKLPDSIVESKPRQTVMILVSNDTIVVQGEAVASVADIDTTKDGDIEAVKDRLTQIKENVIGFNTEAVAKSEEVTILADKAVPFKVMKKLMSTCTSAGYNKISLAVNQKASQS